MAVDNLHINYIKNLSKVKLVRDALEGTSAIIANAITYIPPLKTLDEETNKARVKRPSFDNYVGRTLEGFTGLVFAKNPTYELPPKIEELLDNIDLEDKTMTDIAQNAVNEVLATGRIGILVDVIESNIKEEVSEAIVKQNRPYLSIYPTESIINWRMENNQLVMVVLKESIEKWSDQFTCDYVSRYRVLYLDEQGNYSIDIYETDTKQGLTNKIGKTINPIINSDKMKFIPFVCITPSVLDINPVKPPLFDLADSNISMHRLKVDLYHSLFYTVPTAYGTGIQPLESSDISLGSTKFHLFHSPSAKLQYLEFGGQGLEHYFTEMKNCKDTMGSLGAEFLRNEGNAVEATETVQIRNSADRATLISIAETVSRGLTKALEYMALWLNVAGEVNYSLNTDYNLTKLTAQEIQALSSVWLAGGIRKVDLFHALQKGEIIDSALTFEEWAEQMEMSPNELQ